jgi:mono/diheme cytochrome c family protein
MKRFLQTVLCASVSMGTMMTVATGQTATPSLLTGAYSEEQAIRGQALYYEHCLACHGEMLNGVDQAPPLAGPQFSSIWNNVPLWALVERIGTMPPDKPGTLSRQENVDILAYMLWYNGLPLGNAPLGTQRDDLTQMNFELPPTGQ